MDHISAIKWSIVMKWSVFDGELIGLTHTIIIFEKKMVGYIFYLFFISWDTFFGTPCTWSSSNILLIMIRLIKKICYLIYLKSSSNRWRKAQLWYYFHGNYMITKVSTSNMSSIYKLKLIKLTLVVGLGICSTLNKIIL